MTRTRRFALVTAFVMAAGGVVAAVASHADDAKGDQVRATMHAFHRDVVDGDGKEACALLLPDARQKLVASASLFGDESCEEIVSRVSQEITPLERRDIGRLRIKRVHFQGANTAVIRDEDVELPQTLQSDGNAEPTVLRRVKGAWRIASIG